MTARNRARLRQFDDPVNVARLVNLPETIVRRVLAESLTYNGAIRAQSALAIAIRSGGAAAREKSGRPRAGTGIWLRGLARVPTPPFTWSSPPTRCKNGSALEFELPDAVPQAARSLRHAVSPAAGDRAIGLPVSGQAGRGKAARDSLLGRSEDARSSRKSGLQLNVHLFRHLAAKAVPRGAPPVDLKTVRLLLGHRAWSPRCRMLLRP